MESSNDEVCAIARRASKSCEDAFRDLSRIVNRQLEQLGAASIGEDARFAATEITLALVRRISETGQCSEREIESTVKRLFWSRIFDGITENHQAAYDVFLGAVHRLMHRYDWSRRHEHSWDDIGQVSAMQLLDAWRSGAIDDPWAMLCTVTRRRYLDLVRATRPTVDPTDDMVVDEDGVEAQADLLVGKAQELLRAQEWETIRRMDLEGHTRVEVARALNMTEGRVLSLRRTGVRKLYRMLGAALPPQLEAVWYQMFKGAKRLTVAEAAHQLGMPVDEVSASLDQARELLGLV